LFRLFKAVLCLTVVAALSLSAGAYGSGHRATTTVTLHKQGLHGRVLSNRHRCVKHRKVNLFWEKPSLDRKVATDYSGRDGRFSFAGTKVHHGEYYARVRGVKRGSISCPPARSDRIRIGS
jgi:hypothetical protein